MACARRQAGRGPPGGQWTPARCGQPRLYAIGILAQDQNPRRASQGNSLGTVRAADETNYDQTHALSESSDTGFGNGVIEVVT